MNRILIALFAVVSVTAYAQTAQKPNISLHPGRQLGLWRTRRVRRRGDAAARRRHGIDKLAARGPAPYQHEHGDAVHAEPLGDPDRAPRDPIGHALGAVGGVADGLTQWEVTMGESLRS